MATFWAFGEKIGQLFFPKNLVTLVLRVYAAKQCIFHLSGIL